MAAAKQGDPCPRCQDFMDSDKASNALSRTDNATWICSQCGVEEGIYQIQARNRGESVLLPPVHQPVFTDADL